MRLTLALLLTAQPTFAVAALPSAKEIPMATIRGPEFGSLAELVSRAEVIALGSTSSCALAWSLVEGGHVQWRLKLQVEDVYKGGDVVAGATVTIGRWGGVHVKGEQVAESTVPPRVMQVDCNRRYVVFLRRSKTMNGFDIVGGPQGTFEIRDGVTLLLNQRPERGAWDTLHGLPLARLRDRIQSEQGQ